MFPIHLLKPRHWPTWFAVLILWGLTRLPHRLKMATGRWLGRCFQVFAPRRRHIAAVNLSLCFAERTEAQRQQLLQQHFESLGMGFLEMLSAWWCSDRTLHGLCEIEGFPYLQTALDAGKGVILLSAHFTSLELGSRFLIQSTPICASYRSHENPLIEYLMKQSRARHTKQAIPRDNVRAMLRALEANHPLWFAPDQNFGHKNSVFAPFFGVAAATNTATSRLAGISGAAVIPFLTQRLHNGRSYRITLLPPLDNFPGESMQHDAERINRLIEQQIRATPEQYLWVHRRFKDRPPGEAPFYSK